MSTQTANDFDLALEEYRRAQRDALQAEGWYKGTLAKYTANLTNIATQNDSEAHLQHCLDRLDGRSYRLKKATQKHTASVRSAAKRHIRKADLLTVSRGEV
jgi:hypothetical protein